MKYPYCKFSIGAMASLLLLATPALGQEYPNKPIVMVVPAAAGGPTDTLARVLAAAMGEALKQQLIIDNSGGAGGTIGVNKVAKARPDGYTLLLYHIGLSTMPALYRKLPFDPRNDFEPIGQVADVPMMLIARKTMPAQGFAEFLDYVKVNRDKLSYSNAGVGSASYLCGLLLKSTLQTEFTMVPYKGTGPAMNDLIGGQVDFMCDQSTNTMPQIKSGNVKVYGVATPARLASLPELPTLDEQGLKGFELVVWNGLFAPKGTPKPVLERLLAALQAAVRDPAFGARLGDLGAEPVPPAKVTPASLRELLGSEIDKWSPIIKKSGVYAD